MGLASCDRAVLKPRISRAAALARIPRPGRAVLDRAVAEKSAERTAADCARARQPGRLAVLERKALDDDICVDDLLVVEPQAARLVVAVDDRRLARARRPDREATSVRHAELRILVAVDHVVSFGIRAFGDKDRVKVKILEAEAELAQVKQLIIIILIDCTFDKVFNEAFDVSKLSEDRSCGINKNEYRTKEILQEGRKSVTLKEVNKLRENIDQFVYGVFCYFFNSFYN